MSGNLIEAFQQGWSFVDNIERQKNEDDWKAKTRSRQEKEWQKDDDADAERAQLYDKYFPKQEEPAKPATPQGADVAAKGIPAELPAGTTFERGEATPTDGQLVPAGMGPEITAFGGKPAPTLAEIRGGQPVVSAPEGMGPKITAFGGGPAPTLAQIRGGQPAAAPAAPGDVAGAWQRMNGEATAGNRNMQDWSNGLRPDTAGAGRGVVNPANAVPVPGPGTSTAGAGRGSVNPAVVDPGYQSTAGAGRGFINPPQGTVTAADRSVAPGKVNLNNMTPAQQQKLNELAEKQFGLRFAKAGPADTAQASPAAAQAPRGAEMAASLPVDVKTNPTKIDTRNDLNHMLNFAIDSAKIDLKRGKADGAGLATLIKTAQTIKAEGMDRAVSLMAQGRMQEAQDLYNSAGGHGDMQIVSSQDGFIKVAGQQIPTKIVTMKGADGSIRTVNTAEFQQQGMKISEQLDAVLKGRQIEVDAENAKAQREDTAAYRASIDADRDASRGINERRLKLDEQEAQDRKAERAAKEPAGPKLPEPVKIRLQGIEKRESLYETQRAKVLAENPAADTSAIDKQLLAMSIEKDLLVEPHMPQVNRAARPEPTKPGQTAQATGTGAATAAKGVEAKPKAEPKPAAPAYTPPADSPAGKAVAQREAEIAKRNAGKSAQDEGKKQTQAAFAADVGKLSPKELAAKYDGKQGDLTDAQAAALFKAKNQPAR